MLTTIIHKGKFVNNLQNKLSSSDKVIFDLIAQEAVRQEEHIELIASENYVS